MEQNEKIKKLNIEHTARLKEIISGLTEQTGLVDFYFEEADKLERRDNSFIFCDMDDTLISRTRITEEEELLRKNRGAAGNKLIVNHFGINNIISRFYENQNPPQDIAKLLTPENSVILTAWVVEYQYRKRESIWLTHIPIKIVWDGKDKIMATIQYVLFTLKYIPSEIIIYEDRPQYFIKYRELIEWVLGCELTIMRVEMDGNNGYKKIEQD